MRVTCTVLALSLCLAGPARAQTLEETVATIFYAAGGGSSPNVKLVKKGDCKFGVELFSQPTYEADFALLVRAEVQKTAPRTEVLLVGASSLFAKHAGGTERATTLTIIQNAGTGDKIMAAVAHLRKTYCPGRT